MVVNRQKNGLKDIEIIDRDAGHPMVCREWLLKNNSFVGTVHG